MRFLVFWVVLGWGLGSAAPGVAQRLLWERTVLHNSATANVLESLLNTYLAPGNTQYTVSGDYFVARGNTCLPQYFHYYQTYSPSGVLLRDRAGRGNNLSDTNHGVAAPGGGSWWPGVGYFCVGNVQYPRAYVQRLSAQGDTVGGYWLAPAALPRTTAMAVLTRGSTLVVAGNTRPLNQTGQTWQYSLTCLDTLTGQLRWQQAYPRLPLANDYPSDLVDTPRGGYLISGDGLVGGGKQHYLVETDSLGQLLRQRLYLPLGPTFVSGTRFSSNCNVLVLPNAQGYLLSGSADSTVFMRHIGYVMRLDTALNVQWVYRNPPSTNGNGIRDQFAYKIRLLPNNTVGVVLTDIGNNITPTVYLVQLDITTGQRQALYTMTSSTQNAVVPYDWHWLGDSTVLLVGHSGQVGVRGQQGYVARWDFRATPLAARTAAEARATATFYAFPNPAAGPVTLHWQLPPGQRAGAVRLYSVMGQLLQTVPLPATGAGQQKVSGLAAGLYVARLTDAAGQAQGRAVRLVVE